MTDIEWPTLDEWAVALRSGEYRQGTGSLRTGNKFCCLGVYGDLCVKKGLASWKDDTTTGRYLLAIQRGQWNMRSWLPDTWGAPVTGNGDHFGVTGYDGQPEPLTHANDTLHWDFDQIATQIEAKAAVAGKKP